MYCYFLCDVPCAVKVDGAFIGVASKNLSFIESDKCFLEFIPLDESFDKICFLFDKTHPVSSKNTKIIDLYGGFLLIPQFFRKSCGEFKLIDKKAFDLPIPTLATYFSQNGAKLCISKENDFYVEAIPFTPNEVKFDACSAFGNLYLIAACIANRTEILAFKIADKITLAFKNLCDGYSLSKNLLTTVERRNDILKHTICSTWQFGDSVKLKGYKTTREKQPYALHEKLFAIAFFEEILIDGDLSQFLCPKLNARACEIKEFLGDFTRVLPPPHFIGDDLIMLLYQDKVEYAKVSLENGLIANISIL